MEVQILGYFTWFCIALLFLASLKPARKQFLINLMSGVAFVVLGMCFIAPVVYVAPFSIGDYYYLMDEPHQPYMQTTVGYFFCLFGFALTVNTLFQVLFNKDEEEGYGGLFEKGKIEE